MCRPNLQSAVRTVLITFVSLSFAAPAMPREWVDKTGTFRAEAELVSYDGKVAKLRYESGLELSVPLNKLSDDDVAYLKKTYPDGMAAKAPAKGKAKGGAVTVEVVSLSLVKPSAAQSADSSGLLTPGTHIRLVLSDPDRTFVSLDPEKSKIASCTDDKGTDLAADASQELTLEVAPDGKSAILDLHQLQIPAAQANKIRLKGELHVVCGLGNAETVKVPLNLNIGLGL